LGALTSTVPATVALLPATILTLPPLLVSVAPAATVTLLAEASVVVLPVAFTLPATVTLPLLPLPPTVRELAPEVASFASVSASTFSVGGAGVGALEGVAPLEPLPAALAAAAAAACFFLSSSLLVDVSLLLVAGAAGSTLTAALLTC
jgi:hypothetical protein